MAIPTAENSALLTVRRGLLGLVLLAFLVYAPSLGGSFILDDEALYLDRPAWVRQTLSTAFTHSVPHPSGFTYYRPVAILAHAWLYALFGAHPFVLHLVSVALHAAAAVLVFLLLVEFAAIEVAWFAAALFVVHPLHVEAVAWMGALAEVLTGLLMLASLYLLLRVQRGTPKAWLAAAYFAATLAYFTKETALALPVLAAVFVGWRAWPLALLAGGFLGARLLATGARAPVLPVRSLGERMSTIAACAVHYTRKMLVPWPIALDYDISQPTVIWVAFALACPVVVWLAWRRRDARMAVALFAIPLLPALAASIALPPLSQAQDRYAYLAVLGATLAVAFVARTRRGAYALLGLLVAWSALSIAAIPHWRDPEALWSHTLRVTPASRNAVLGLGEWYYNTQRFAEAERVYDHGLALRPNDRDFLTSRAAVRKILSESRHQSR